MSLGVGSQPSRFVEHEGGMRLAVYDEPDDPRPPVVVAHGAGSSGWFVLEAFAEAVEHDGSRLVAYDLRGHAASTPLADPAAHALDHHVADLAAVVADVGARVVAGVSLGAAAAVRLAATRGEAELLAVGAVLPPWSGRAPAGEGPHAAIAADVRSNGVGPMRERIAADTTLVPWLREVLTRDYARHDPTSLAAALVALDGGEAPSLDEVAGLAVPLGTVGWPDDPGHPLEVATAWAAAAPRGAHEATSLDEMQRDRSAFGRALSRALHAAAT